MGRVLIKLTFVLNIYVYMYLIVLIFFRLAPTTTLMLIAITGQGRTTAMNSMW